MIIFYSDSILALHECLPTQHQITSKCRVVTVNLKTAFFGTLTIPQLLEATEIGGRMGTAVSQEGQIVDTRSGSSLL